MKYQIITTRWWTPPVNNLLMDSLVGVHLCIGVVAIKTGTGQWKAYIGYGRGLDKEIDAQAVAGFGMPLDKQTATAMFPDLNSKDWTA